MATEEDVRRKTAIAEYNKKLLQHRELESRSRKVKEELRTAKKELAKTEDDLKSLQSVGQIIGEVLRPLDNERLIVKASSGPRYVVGCRNKVDKEKLTSGTRVVLDMTTLTIMRALPREVDPVVYNMLHEDPGNISYSAVGGLSDQIRELRESIELPLMNPELFLRVGIKPPKGVLLYGPPGTGKTLLARAIASNIDANFLKVVSSAIIDKYIGESARLIREMFGYARDHQPCIIFMDEIDAIGGRRFSEGTSADREIQRTLMELLNQLDGFDQLGKVKMIMATNRPDVLDPALLRPGRLDRKIEIPLPNEQSRIEILKIHAAGIAKHGEIDYEAIVKLAEGFNGADLRNICTEAGMSAIRAERDYVIHEDFMKVSFTLLDYQRPGLTFRSGWVGQFRVMKVVKVMVVVVAGTAALMVVVMVTVTVKVVLKRMVKVCVEGCRETQRNGDDNGGCQEVDEAKKLESSAHYSADFGKE
ncbi:26S proteasome regulatory subunit 10B-like protein A [Bienertia sinuspersici]